MFDELKEKEENVSEEIVQDYIEECYKNQREKQLKIIRKSFSNLVERVRKIEKMTIAKLDEEIRERKAALFESTNIKDL